MGKVSCSKLGVDCVVNDPVDVRAGGPQYLGFDFFVRVEDTAKMITYIKATLNEFNIPLIKLSNNGVFDLSESAVWTKDRIFNCIESESEMLLSEAARDYKVVSSKK